MQVANGTTDVTTYFVLRDSTNHAPKTDVTITNIDLYYCEQGAAMAAKIDATALDAADSAHADNKAYHVGQGLYRIDWPDAAFDGGVGKVVNLIVVCTDVDTTFFEVQLSPPVDVVMISGDSTAANNAESFFDGTGYAGTNNVIPTVTTLTGHTAQTGDAYAVVAHADYGNAKLVRSTTPANTLTVDASHQALADVRAISGDSTAADRLEAILDAMPGGAVVDDNDPDPTATAFETNLSEATNDHYNGAFVVFTSGALLGQSRKISDYDGTSKVLTVAAAFTEAPTAGDTFLILGRSE